MRTPKQAWPWIGTLAGILASQPVLAKPYRPLGEERAAIEGVLAHAAGMRGKPVVRSMTAVRTSDGGAIACGMVALPGKPRKAALPYMVLVMWNTGRPEAAPVAVGGSRAEQVGAVVTCRQRGNPITGMPIPAWAR